MPRCIAAPLAGASLFVLPCSNWWRRRVQSSRAAQPAATLPRAMPPPGCAVMTRPPPSWRSWTCRRVDHRATLLRCVAPEASNCAAQSATAAGLAVDGRGHSSVFTTLHRAHWTLRTMSLTLEFQQGHRLSRLVMQFIRSDDPSWAACWVPSCQMQTSRMWQPCMQAQPGVYRRRVRHLCKVRRSGCSEARQEAEVELAAGARPTGHQQGVGPASTGRQEGLGCGSQHVHHAS